MADPVSPEALPAIVPRGDQTLSSSAADTAVSPDKLEETALALREQPDAALAKAGARKWQRSYPRCARFSSRKMRRCPCRQ